LKHSSQDKLSIKNIGTEGSTMIIRLLSSLTLFLAGWLFNFFFDIQFVSGVFVGWLMKEGYDDIANLIMDIIN
jgi:hypothetical protein